MDRYQRGKIYKIISCQTELVYIGSTIEKLSQRMSVHRSKMRAFNEGLDHYYTSFEILKYTDAKIVLIEDYPCQSKEQLLAREQYYIDNTPCVNCQAAQADPLTKQISSSTWKHNNKEKNLQITREWRTNNQGAVKDYSMKYYQEHREDILEKRREERINSPILNCPCGRPYKAIREKQHINSKHHQNYEKSKLIF